MMTGDRRSQGRGYEPHVALRVRTPRWYRANRTS